MAKKESFMGMNLRPAGVKPEQTEPGMQGQPVGSGTEDASPRYPSLYVNDKEMPAIDELQDGESIMVARVRVARRTDETTLDDTEGKKQSTSATIEILSATFKPVGKSKKPEDMTDEELNSNEAEPDTDTDDDENVQA